ncbi:MAG: hypothetical protein DRI46_10875 [Chloroflexi bacterium]|nr:MAG: hypothetical protein DRI46_10875 [Chloroflexota bacterium]
MGKVATDGMIDGGLDKVITCTTLTVCAGEPTSIGDITTKALASVVVDGADFTKAAGDVSGRKAIVGQQTNIPIIATGTADHVVIGDGVDYEVTTATAQLLTSGGTVTVPAWDIEIADPV